MQGEREERLGVGQEFGVQRVWAASVHRLRSPGMRHI